MIYNNHPEYKKDFWRTIAIHDENNIRGFFGKYRFLSNFTLCKVLYEDIYYPSSENAYQAAKVRLEHRGHFINISPLESKKEWKKHPLIDKSSEKWDERKYSVMSEILSYKFMNNQSLKESLLMTKNKYLEETNWWKDTFYGYDVELGYGDNNLGKILMNIRETLNH